MLEGGFMFSNAQALGALTSTGVVSTNVLDMELAASGGATILENDQLVGVLNIVMPGIAAQAGTEGMNIYLRSCDATDMTTSAIDLGMCHVSAAEMVTGCVKNISVCVPLTQKYVGVFYDPVSTTLTTGQTVDAYFSTAPLTLNDSVQKVPS
jgi:hypothetical protein